MTVEASEASSIDNYRCSEASAEGSQASADRVIGNYRRSEASADRIIDNYRCSEASAEGSEASAEGSEASAEGSEASAEGSEASAEGSQASADRILQKQLVLVGFSALSSKKT